MKARVESKSLGPVYDYVEIDSTKCWRFLQQSHWLVLKKNQDMAALCQSDGRQNSRRECAFDIERKGCQHQQPQGL